MINQIILVGRLASDPEIEDYETGKKRTIINLAVQRNFKNIENKYETDFFRCVLWNGLASSTKEYCHQGDIVGIKGRIQNRSYIDESKNTKYITEIIAEKITFLTSTSKKDDSKKQNVESKNQNKED